MMKSSWRSWLRAVALNIGAALGVLCIAWTLSLLLLGLKPIVFVSGSMSPAIDVGAVGFSRSVPAADVRVGDIITVRTETDELVTHRVTSATPTDDSVLFRLKGDANGNPDPKVYELTEVDRVVATIPNLGFVLMFAASPYGLGVGVGLVALSLWLGFSPRFRARPHGPEATVDKNPSPPPGTTPSRGLARISSFLLAHRAKLAVPALAAAMLIGMSVVPSRGTLAYFSDTHNLKSPTDGITTAPWFTCAQANSVTGNGTVPWSHYTFDENTGLPQVNGSNPYFLDDTGNGRHGIYFEGSSALAVTPTAGQGRACKRDITSHSVYLAGTSKDNAEYIRDRYSAGAANGPNGARWNTFSVNVWFRTNVTAAEEKGGVLAAYSTAATNTDDATDRILYVDAAGNISFLVYPSAYRVITTSGTNYADNVWHMATATLSSAGQCLYVDGKLVRCDTATTSAYQTPTAMYWRFGYAFLADGVPGVTPGNTAHRAFKGFLEDAGIWTRALSAKEIRDMYRAALRLS